MDGPELSLQRALDNLEKTAGGRSALIDAVAASQHPKAKAFVTALGLMENEDKSLYEIAKSVSPNPHELQKYFSQGLRTQSVIKAYDIMFRDLPDLMRVSLDAATEPDGHQERKMLFQMAGLFPKDGGININLNQNFGGMMEKGMAGKVARGSGDLMHDNPFEIVVEAEDDETA
jgi:hypothetical protein